MIVLITSSTPNRRRRTAAMPAQSAPPHAPAISATTIAIGPPLGAMTPTTVANVAPSNNWPSAPMLNTPARNAIDTAHPDNINGTARTSVEDVRAYHEPKDPPHNATSA